MGFQLEVIGHAMGISPLPLLLRMVEELLPARGSHHQPTKPCGAERANFGQCFANQIRRVCPGLVTSGISTELIR